MLEIDHSLQIPLEEFEFSFARSGGPGGQNVNKVNSKAIMRWSVMTSPSLPDDVRQRFMDKFANRLTADGELVLSSQKFREQGRNVDDCLEKLREMLLTALRPPRLRKRTKPTQAMVRRRVEKKRQTGQKKQSRRKPTRGDWE